MANKLSQWFKDNCKDIGHINYGKIRQLIEATEPSEEWIEEKARELQQEFKDGSLSVLSFCKFFIHTLAQELPMRKPKVSKKKFDEYSMEMDGEMPPSYYDGANRAFEWLANIIGMEVTK